MGKRPIAIVPNVHAAAPAKRPKKAVKKAREAEPEAPAAAAAADAADGAASADGEHAEQCKLLTVRHSPTDATARAASTLSEPDAPDKAARFLAWLVAPLSPHEFLAAHGKRPVFVSREACRGYFDGVFSTGELSRQLRACSLRWGDEVDAALYTLADGRTTHNGEGVAAADDVWARYAEGCSIRLSWPQRHSDALWGVIEALEEFFGSGGGANVYATPPGAQGFAPHWDDIDAFVMQIEGEKRWRLYAPRSVDEAQPRFSSPNLAQDELGAMLGEVTLRAGDLLYLPRGIVHQAVTSSGVASLHVTASVGRQHAWRDLLEVGVLGALEAGAMAHPEWRETLPVDFGSHLGIAHAEEGDEEEEEEDDDDDEGGGGGGHGANGANGANGGGTRAAGAGSAAWRRRRAAMGARLRTMLHQLIESMPLDDVADQFVCQRFLHDRMPPRLSSHDAARRPTDPDTIAIDSRIRLTSRSVARLAIEDGVAALYYSSSNSRSFHGHAEPQHLDFDLSAAPALETVLTAYPRYVTVGRLPADSDAQRLDIARALVEAQCVLLKPEPTDKQAVRATAAAAAAAAAAAGWDLGGGSTDGTKKTKKKKKKPVETGARDADGGL